ncbi:MAG: hypothetical protein GXO70_00690 [Acidobacteria bacterium]|nr:hypothetical protein [Acidobacteriota bacterium]
MKKTMNGIEFREYFKQIESYFALKREQILLLSPEEFQLVDRFFQENVPVELILRGIDRFFEKKKKSRRKSRRPVFLTHVQTDIEEIIHDYNRKGIGSHLASGPTETEFVQEKLTIILHRLEKVSGNAKTPASKATEKIRPLLERAKEETMEEIETELEAISKVANNEIFDTLDPEIERKVEERIRTILEQTDHSISKDIENRFKTDTALEMLGFPVISLYT